MTIGNRINLAGKYFTTHFRRYLFIMIILSFSFGVIMTVTTVTEGMEQNVFRVAENHYGGHLFVFGFDRPKYRITNVKGIQDSIASIHLDEKKTALRTLSYGDGILYFGGHKVKQKYVFGMDWDYEKNDFRDELYADNIFPETLGIDGIIISAAIAEELHARLSDDVILEVTTKNGQKNTGTFIVRGIIKDKSIFGYFKCYVDRIRLNEMIGFDQDDCSWIGYYFKDHRPEVLTKKAFDVYSVLKDKFPMSPPATTREEFAREFERPSSALRYPIFTLYAYISQVSDLLMAIKLTSYFLFVAMIVIAIASMSVSIRLILHERAKEIGTLRVMGLAPFDTQMILVMESAISFTIALCAGLALSFLLNRILSLFSYSSIPGFEIFLHKGSLTAAYTITTFLFNSAIFFLSILPFAWIPVFKMSRIEIIKVLSGETL